MKVPKYIPILSAPNKETNQQLSTGKMSLYKSQKLKKMRLKPSNPTWSQRPRRTTEKRKRNTSTQPTWPHSQASTAAHQEVVWCGSTPHRDVYSFSSGKTEPKVGMQLSQHCRTLSRGPTWVLPHRKQWGNLKARPLGIVRTSAFSDLCILHCCRQQCSRRAHSQHICPSVEPGWQPQQARGLIQQVCLVWVFNQTVLQALEPILQPWPGRKESLQCGPIAEHSPRPTSPGSLLETICSHRAHPIGQSAETRRQFYF